MHVLPLHDALPILGTHGLRVAKKIAPAIQRAIGAESVNIFAPNGKDGGQEVAHFHLHILPVRPEIEIEGEEEFLSALEAEVPTRPELDIMAARISRAIQDTNQTELQ